MKPSKQRLTIVWHTFMIWRPIENLFLLLNIPLISIQIHITFIVNIILQIDPLLGLTHFKITNFYYILWGHLVKKKLEMPLLNGK